MRVHLFLPAAVIIAPHGQIEIISFNCDLESEPANKFAFTSLFTTCMIITNPAGRVFYRSPKPWPAGVSSRSVDTPSRCEYVFCSFILIILVIIYRIGAMQIKNHFIHKEICVQVLCMLLIPSGGACEQLFSRWLFVKFTKPTTEFIRFSRPYFLFKRNNGCAVAYKELL